MAPHLSCPPSKPTRFLGDLSVYLARHLTSELLVGASFYVGVADGRTVYNGAVANKEESDFYAFSPFVSYDIALGEDTLLIVGGRLTASFGDFEYDINIPPTASTERVSLHFPRHSFPHVHA